MRPESTVTPPQPKSAQPQSNGPTLPAVRMNVVRPTAPVAARVVRNVVCTASRKASGFVRHIELDVGDTPLAGSFRAGQSFGVIPPGLDARGKRHAVRLYSLACPSAGEDGAGRIVSTTVKRTVDEHWNSHALFLGVASNFLCDRHEGDAVDVSGPSGRRFLLPERPEEHDYVFFATGTGVAPFRGMTLDLLAARVQSRIALVMGSPYATDLLYHDEFSELARTHDNFHYIAAISRHAQNDGEGPMYANERLRTHADLLGGMLASERGLVYICGVEGMEVGVLRGLTERLPRHAFEQYVTADKRALAEAEAWTPRQIGREVKTTGRVFIEVY